MPQFGLTPLSTTTLGANQFPISAAFVPGTANGDLTAVEGILINTDGNGYKSTAIRLGLLDGDDVTLGHKADARSSATDTTAITAMQVFKQLSYMLQNPASTPVTGTFWQATQPVSIASLPALPANQSVNVAQLAGTATDTNSGSKSAGTQRVVIATDQPQLTNAMKVDGSAVTQPVSGTFWQATQPVSGTVTANAGTNLNTSALALEAGHLANIDTHTPALGQATKVNSSPVVIASDQGDLFIKGDFTEQASLSAGSLNADLVPSTDISAYNEWVLQVGAIAGGGTLTFQGSNDNSTFVSILAFNAGSTAAPSATTSATGIFYGPRLYRYLRVRQTAWTSGSTTGTLELYTATSPFVGGTLNVGQSGVWTVQPGNTANTVPWLASIHDGTNKANNLAATSVSNAVGSQGAQLVAGAYAEQASLSAGSLNADLVPSVDVSNYKAFSLQIGSSAFVGTLSFQWSNDNVTFLPLFMWRIDTPSAGAGATATAIVSQGWWQNIAFRYLRIRMTAYTSGTAQGTLELYTQPIGQATSAMLQTGTWTVQPGNTQNTTPWLTQGPTSTGTQAANTAGNTVIKGSAGALWTATVTTLGTVGLDIFDNASTNAGTKLLSIPASAPVGTIYAFPAGQPAANGIVSAGVTNCPGVTFGYR